MAEYKIDPYELQMKALTQMAQAQNTAQERKANLGTQAQMMRHLGSFADVASRPVITQAEIMAKQTPKSPGLGQGWQEAAQGLETRGAEDYQGLLDKYKMQNQMATTLARLKEIEEEKKDRALKRRFMEAQISSEQTKAQNVLPKLTKGQEKVDTEFGQEWAKFKTLGGSTVIDKNLSQLQKVYDALDAKVKGVKDAPSISGPWLGKIPDQLKSIYAPEAVNIQELVAEVAQGNLRQVLGGQFAQKEGEQLIKRAFNPELDESVNRERVGRLIAQIKKASQAKIDAGRVFDAQGTLSGYKGPLYQNIESDEERPKGRSLLNNIIPEAQAAPMEVIKPYKGKRYRLKPGADPKKKESWEVM